MLSHRYYGLEFYQKEKEIRKLKAELEQIESERQRPILFTTSPPLPFISPAFHPFAPMLSPIKPQDPSKLFGMTHTLFRNNPLPKPSRSKPHPRPSLENPPFPPPLSIPEQQPPLYTPLPPQPAPTQAKDKSPMQQYSAQIIPDPSDTNQTSNSNLAVSEDPSDSEIESSISSSDSEKSYADITKILMAQPEETKPAQSSRTDPFFEIPSDIEEDPPEASSALTRPAHPQNDHKPSNGPWFTFDDIPVAKWRDKLSEMAAWIDLQMLRANATTTSVLRELATRFKGSLRD
ncbi:vegetative cell wall protein gp1-like [Citrus sinensis]|uniref:vegetative cell wall protein gp1-like n=1 Tax=Citrus sinensis TaxID=2711 RepID=UPI002277FC49|nr:vegetative cell wall protein gp1-like [Citrus sinensis]